MAGNMFNVPHVLSADSVKGLRTRMLENNLADKTEYVYYQIIFDSKRYHAFYMKSAESLILPTKRESKKAKG